MANGDGAERLCNLNFEFLHLNKVEGLRQFSILENKRGAGPSVLSKVVSLAQYG
jgi:hypothetical protein